jgi:uncharacterized membrane protein YcaP (DUF421 family)
MITMDWDLIWKAVAIVIGGTFLLRIAGRKSISQMTLAQTVIMIGIGSLLIQPIAGENMGTTLLAALILVLTLITIELLQVKIDPLESLVTGKSRLLIKGGMIQEKNLRKMRMTVDQLEMTLRLQSVERIEDVQWATLEANGRVAYLLKKEAQPVTKYEFDQLKSLLEAVLENQQKTDKIKTEELPPEQQDTLFAEVNRRGHKNVPPKHLQ